MASAQQMAADNPQLAAAVQRSRRLLHRRALVAAAASTVPVPGLDWAVDAALLSRLLPQISAQFGLTPEQLDQLDPGKREQVQKAVTLVGSVLIGKLITKELVLRITRTVGLRLTSPPSSSPNMFPWQARRWPPLWAMPPCATWESSTCAIAFWWCNRVNCSCPCPADCS